MIQPLLKQANFPGAEKKPFLCRLGIVKNDLDDAQLRSNSLAAAVTANDYAFVLAEID